MANLNVSYDEIDAVAADLQTGQGEANDLLDALKGKVDALVASGFQTDQASGQFEASYEEFTSGVKQVLEGLEGMSGYLKNVAETLAEVDEQLAAGLRG